MKVVWKHTLTIKDQQIIELPKGSRIICAQMQGEQLCIWFGHELLAGQPRDRDDVVILIRGTGHEFAPMLGERYINTVQLAGGSLIFHVYAVGA